MDSFSDSTFYEANTLDQISLESIEITNIFNNSLEMDRFTDEKTGPIFEQFALELFVASVKTFEVDLAFRVGWKLSYRSNEDFYRKQVADFLAIANLEKAFENHLDAHDLEADGPLMIRNPEIGEISGEICNTTWEITLPALVLVEVSVSSSEKSLTHKLWQLIRNLAILRHLDIKRIQMGEGSLELWTDDEIKHAIKNTHFFVMSDGGTNSPSSLIQLDYKFSRHLIKDRYKQLLGIADLRFIYIDEKVKERQRTNEATQINQSSNEASGHLIAENKATPFEKDGQLRQPIRRSFPSTNNPFGVLRSQINYESSEGYSSDKEELQDSKNIAQSDEFEKREDNLGELTGQKKIKKN